MALARDRRLVRQRETEAPLALAREREAESGWDPLLAWTAVYILASVGRIHQVFSTLALFRPAIVAGLIAIVLYVFDRQEARGASVLRAHPARYLVVLAAWMVLSIPSALVLGNSFELVFNNFLKIALMVFVTAGAVRNTRDVERLTFAYLAGATIYSFAVLTRFDLGADWRLGDLYYYDANDFATFAVTALPLSVYFLHAGRGRLMRLCAAAALAILAVGFVRAGSRGGFIALLAVGAFILFRFSAIRFHRRVLAAGIVALLVLGAASDHFWTQMTTMFSDSDYNRTEETGRLRIWSRGIGYMLDKPLFGVGPGNFQTAEATQAPIADQLRTKGVGWNAAHNSFVQIGAELGIPGLLLFIAIIAGTLRLLWHGGGLAQALAASLVGFVVGAFFLSLAYADMLYVLIALGIGLQKVTRAQERNV